MSFEQWEHRYHGLKAELEDAYAKPHWDSERIDEIASALLQVEHQLSPSVIRGLSGIQPLEQREGANAASLAARASIGYIPFSAPSLARRGQVS